MGVLVIAEAGVNHNGDEALAFELVNKAAEAGADIVKFQTFKASKLVTHSAEQCAYQISNTKKKESQFDMLRRLELSYEAHFRLLEHCRCLGIEFLSTAFDLDSLSFLVAELGLSRLKIPSGEITNAPLILAYARSNCDLLISTGMATLAEVEFALGVIAFGFVSSDTCEPTLEAFQEAYTSKTGQRLLKEKVVILHCTTEYPAPIEDINLRAMDTLSSAFGMKVGYSDHSEGLNVPIAAVARGATVIEKHFTLDRGMIGPDHKASIEPDELKSMVRDIRSIELALGDGIKGPRLSEIENKKVARKSLVAISKIAEGEEFSISNVGVKRPGTGVSPTRYWEYLGQSSSRTYAEGDLIID
ncbi:N-acetylneuraminate synthase [Gammaproteobacteria bacterium 45_16_T64]|nr:N-acetylneuraminate synthase [Gammaproteobacteria bacterium 45_16_T64]